MKGQEVVSIALVWSSLTGPVFRLHLLDAGALSRT